MTREGSSAMPLRKKDTHMDLIQAMKDRHSVRSYHDRPIAEELVTELGALVDECNSDGRLHIQLVTNEPRAFGESRMARYGKFSGVSNYLAMVGKKGPQLDERVGYYGEKIVLEAQRMGLNTCWVGLTFKKIPDAVTIGPDEKLVCVIAIGYGTTQGATHKLKKPEKVTDTPIINTPNWYHRGIAAALLAPTAMNQQKFAFRFESDRIVSARAKTGFFSHVDLGIVKYHFEVGADKRNFVWKLK